jgi:hypothetical protein
MQTPDGEWRVEILEIDGAVRFRGEAIRLPGRREDRLARGLHLAVQDVAAFLGDRFAELVER